MAEAILSLSHRANLDHTADDFTVGQRVKAHPATDTFMRGDVYGIIEFISSNPKRLVLVKKGSQRKAHSFWRSQSSSC